MAGRSLEDWARRARAEGPFLVLLMAAMAALPTVSGQGGTAEQACAAALAVLAAPAAAIEPMLAIARVALRIERRPG